MKNMENENIIKDDETFIYHESNFIDSPEVLDKLLNIKKSRPPDRTNLKTWGAWALPEGVGEVRIWTIDDYDLIKYLNLRLAIVFEKVRSSDFYFYFEVTEWQPDSFIPWHCDSPHFCAATCYLDSNTFYGGDFMCKPFADQSLGMFLEPVVNRVVLLKGVEHSVSKIHLGTRTTLQMWGKKIDADL